MFATLTICILYVWWTLTEGAHSIHILRSTEVWDAHWFQACFTEVQKKWFGEVQSIKLFNLAIECIILCILTNCVLIFDHLWWKVCVGYIFDDLELSDATNFYGRLGDKL